jgi:Family of unknown function (DUF5681)
MTTSKKYEVGYCKPPERYKWKKGQCGNPKRIRKHPVKPVAALVDEFFAREVGVVDNGVSQRCPAFEVIFSQLCNKAMAGNRRALQVLKQYSDFAASRAPSGGMRAVLVDEETQRKMARGENG